MASSSEQLVPLKYNFKCRKCGSLRIFYYTWEDDDCHEDIHYRCDNCKREWWVEGLDY